MSVFSQLLFLLHNSQNCLQMYRVAHRLKYGRTPPPGKCEGAAEMGPHTQEFWAAISTPSPLPRCYLL